MDEGSQIIAFIRLGDVWATRNWLGEELAAALGFRVGDGELGGGAKMFYVYPDGRTEAFGYDATKLTAALYALVPDSCPNWNNHQPSVPFKFVYHSNGDHSLFEGYSDNENCKGFERSTHEAVQESVYFQICNEIKSIYQGNPPNPGPIWDMITSKSWIEEQGLRLLNFLRDPDYPTQITTNLDNLDGDIKKLLKHDNQRIENWINNAVLNETLDCDGLRKELGLD